MITDHRHRVKDVFTAANALVDLSVENEKIVPQGIIAFLSENDGSKSTKFPMKLMRVLDNSNEYGHIISWTPDGLSFTVLSPKQLEAVILPAVFETKAKYSSFQRKLYRWGFLKKYHHADDHTYFHKSFQRGKESLCFEELTRPFRQKRKTGKYQDNGPNAMLVNREATVEAKRDQNADDQEMTELSIVHSTDPIAAHCTKNVNVNMNSGVVTTANVSLIAKQLGLLNNKQQSQRQRQRQQISSRVPKTTTTATSTTRMSSPPLSTTSLVEDLLRLRQQRVDLLLANAINSQRKPALPTLNPSHMDINMMMEPRLTSSSISSSNLSSFNHDSLTQRMMLSSRMKHKEIINGALSDLVARQTMIERNK